MEITNAKWQEAEHKIVLCAINGKNVKVPSDPKNSHYKEILPQNMTIAGPT